MSVYARLRVLLAVSVFVIGGSVWLIAGQQRDAVIGMQAQLRASSDLLTSMLDQETGLRGYALTGRKSFLEPYDRGTVAFERALEQARAGRGRERVTAALLRDLTSTARQWQANARTAVDQVERRGPNAISIDDAEKRKALMDRFREQNAALRTHVEQRTQDGLKRARWIAFGFVMLFGGSVLSLGMVAVERQARRDGARRKHKSEFIEALQGADDELEAKELLRRRAERIAPGADAVVLTSNASGNSLTAATDPAGMPRLAEALVDATPRSCLAIRRGQTHERRPDSAPLQICELCHRADGGSVCVPELVAGEVIGSLLVIKHGRVKPVELDGITGAVAQAAPILANLRNLAIAEHRAATDPLTKLPNARSVQEALIRMVAQAHRSQSPLSAIVIDLDRFKALNDRHGHQAGDEVLETVGTALRRGVRASDFAGRWGGEEFVVLLPDTDHEGAMQAAETMRSLLDGLHVPAVTAHITASLGVATLPDHAADGTSLIRAADRALYLAKAAGRNCVMTTTPDEQPVGGPGSQLRRQRGSDGRRQTPAPDLD
jgi:diguanylate cyclase (GGDEF)-like protein